MELFELIQTLVSAHGPSGNEGGIREAIRKLAAPYGGKAFTDTMGNLTIRKPGPGPKVMLCAHMDSVGFIVTHIEKEGFLRVGKLGGVAPQEPETRPRPGRWSRSATPPSTTPPHFPAGRK